MPFNENNESSQYEKQLSNIESYLLRIIKRYFAIEDLNNSIIRESIIVEAMSRFKAEIDYEVAPVLSINDLEGIVSMSIYDLGGEKAFEKNSAFNKDFGASVDTIVAGDDYRLTNEREPIDHIHNVKSFPGIVDIFRQYEKIITEIVKSYHSHYNYNALNKIIYNGSRSSIDLILLEELQSSINALINHVNTRIIDVENITQNYINALETQFKVLYDMISIVKNGIDGKNNEIKNEILSYSSSEIEQFSKYIEELTARKVTSPEINKMIDILNRTYRFVGAGEISLSTTLPTMSGGVSSDNGNSLEEMYNTSLRIQHSGTEQVPDLSYWTWSAADGSFQCTQNTPQYVGFISDKAYDDYEHSVRLVSTNGDNDIVSVILAYTEDPDGKQHTLSLVFVSSEGPDTGFPIARSASVIYDFELNTAQLIAQGSMPINAGYHNWNEYPLGISTKTIRNGANFTIYHSDWNSTTLHATPDITFSLTDNPVLDKFSGAKRYGYACKSQAESKFLDVNFIGYSGTVLTEPAITTAALDPVVLTNLNKVPNIRTDMRIDLYLKYTDNDEVLMTKLPFMCVTNELNSVIKAELSETGEIRISAYPISGEAIPVKICQGFIFYKIYAPLILNKL